MSSRTEHIPEDVKGAFDMAVRRAEERLYEDLDRLAQQRGVSDADLLALIETRVDVAEGYREWIADGD